MAELVRVKHSNGKAIYVSLDLNATLRDTRTNLIFRGYMTKKDSFIFNNDLVSGDEEKTLKLSKIVVEKGNKKELTIGDPTVPPRDPTEDIPVPKRFQDMEFVEKKDVLGAKHVNVFVGMTFKEERGKPVFTQTFKKLYEFHSGYIPVALNPRLEVDNEEFTSFRQDTHSVQMSGTDTASVSLSTPYVSAEAEYKKVREESHSTDKIHSYYTQRYLRNMVQLKADLKKMRAESDFADALREAVKDQGMSLRACLKVIRVLNEFGWYVPLEYTLGGAVYATNEKEILKWEDSLKESESFKTSFKANIADYSGGGSVGKERGKDETTTGEDRKERVELKQIGGTSDAAHGDFTQWSKSLNHPSAWRMISFGELLPSLMLLFEEDSDLLSTCLILLEQYALYVDVTNEQPHISVKDYHSGIVGKYRPIYD